MENTLQIKVSELTNKHFERYPLWTWVEDYDSEDLVCPVLESNPSPDDYGTLFIKATFWTPNGLNFKGHVVFSGQVYAIDFSVHEKSFVFNVHLRDLAEKNLTELQKILNIDRDEIFPLEFKAEYKFPNGFLVSGIFNSFG